MTVSAYCREEMGACLNNPLPSIKVKLHAMPLSFLEAPLLVYYYAMLSFNTSSADASALIVMYHTIGLQSSETFTLESVAE